RSLGRGLGIGLLLAAGAAAWGQPAPSSPDAGAPELRPSPLTTAPALPGAAPGGQPPPPEACYRAAREGGEDAYVCDLAVQIARDGGSPAQVAAALANRALVLAREGRLEPALADLDAALAATPDDPVLHGNRGNLLLRLGRPAEALAAHSRAVE